MEWIEAELQIPFNYLNEKIVKTVAELQIPYLLPRRGRITITMGAACPRAHQAGIYYYFLNTDDTDYADTRGSF